MPKPIEPFPPYSDYKTITFKLSRENWQKVKLAMKLKSRKAGHPYSLQQFFAELCAKL